MKQQIKSLEEEKTKLREQLQTAQACKYLNLLLIVSCQQLHIHWKIPVSGSSSDQARLVAAAQVIVDMVDSEEGSSSSKSLVERLEEAPKKFFDIMTATSKNYLTHMLGIVKSY